MFFLQLNFSIHMHFENTCRDYTCREQWQKLIITPEIEKEGKTIILILK